MTLNSIALSFILNVTVARNHRTLYNVVKINTEVFKMFFLFFFLQISKIDSDVIVHRLTSENINDSDQFQDLVANLKSLNKTVYVVSEIQPADGILTVVKKADEIKNVRYDEL